MPSHSVTLELAEPVAPRLDAGALLTLKVTARCSQGCNLTGQSIDLVDAQGHSVVTETLDADSAEITVAAPANVGKHDWALRYAGHEDGGIVHSPASHPLVLETKAHDTSLAVWDVPSPVPMNEACRVTVGATCTSGCNLAGKQIAIHDEAGNIVGSGILGEMPWPQTKALYWTDAKLTAPPKEGRANWIVRFAATELKLPHGHASFQFGAQIVRPPQHRVTIRVAEKESGAPLENVQIRLGVFVAYSDKDGVARLETPADTYELDALKTGYDAVPTNLAITEDLETRIEMTLVPKEDPNAHWYHYPDKD